jgi:hypothetical protein
MQGIFAQLVSRDPPSLPNSPVAVSEAEWAPAYVSQKALSHANPMGQSNRCCAFLSNYPAIGKLLA